MQPLSQTFVDRDPECVCSDVARLEQEVVNLRRALETRQLIGMAQGIIIAREKCHPERAFEALSRASQRQNRKVTDIARQIVDRNTLGSGEPTSGAVPAAFH